MKALRKVTDFVSRLEDDAAFLAFLLVFLIGLYAMYDSVLVYLDASDTNMLKYKPDYTGETPEKPITGNMVAWLTLDDTDIDYPVMQGENNSEYLSKNAFGEYSLSGSIFLDSRNSEDFTDAYSLLYGHHMEGGVMFGGLDEFLEEDYFDSHRTGTLSVGAYQAAQRTEYEIRLFAVVETNATEEAIFAPTAVDIKETVQYIKENALYADDEILQELLSAYGIASAEEAEQDSERASAGEAERDSEGTSAEETEQDSERISGKETEGDSEEAFAEEAERDSERTSAEETEQDSERASAGETGQDFGVADEDIKILGMSTCKYPDTADRTVVLGILSGNP